MANREPRIIKQADKVAYDFVFNQTKRAFKRVEAERHGKGCGCLSCARRTVQRANSWTKFICGENEHAYNRHKYDVHKGEIVPPYSGWSIEG